MVNSREPINYREKEAWKKLQQNNDEKSRIEYVET